MFSPDDTIVAIATPPGRGGIGVVRLSGPCAPEIGRSLLGTRTLLKPRYATLGTVSASLSREGARTEPTIVDQVLATYFPAPASYTGEDVVEISAHGSPPVLTQIVEAAMAAGARLAEPGEFTFRAYLNGRLDLMQAEAVADLIDAVTPRQARLAFDQLQGGLTRPIAELHSCLFDLIARLEASLDFPDEGYHFVQSASVQAEVKELCAQIEGLLAGARRGRLIREGARVVIAGKVNVGKSSIFNRLAGTDRAIVTEIAGTTRDLVTEVVGFDGIPVTLVDTAGIRDAADVIEQEGINRAWQSLGVADVVLLILDRSCPLTLEDRDLIAGTASLNRVIALNKTDLPAAWPITDPDPAASPVEVSAYTGLGIEALRAAAIALLCSNDRAGVDLEACGISNVRHIQLLEEASGALSRAHNAAAAGLSEEFVLIDLQEARSGLEEVTGVRTSDEVLSHIFARFCIGK